MYDFNLLPKEKQKSTRQWVMKQQLIVGMVLVNIVLISICGTLAVLHFSLQQVLSASAAPALMTHANTTSTQNDGLDIQYINTRIQQLRLIQKDHSNYLGLLQEISTLLPEGVSIHSIDIDAEKTTLIIDGIAAERTDLQAMQQKIEQDNRFVITQFPFDALTAPKDIPFTIAMTFIPAAFHYEAYE
ncbi:MAG: hypothetical protein HYV32_00950 [Candidatus Kerfeldbacteria bacterium]|nr:hypothetical protein [Candidatus Kerfeldbacteria bacterium]